MKTSNLALILTVTLSLGTAFAQGGKRSTQAIRTSCGVCDRLTQLSEEIRGFSTIGEEVERLRKSYEVVSKVAEAVETRLKTAGKNKLSTLEIDAILKFEAEFQKEDDSHQLIELIHPFYLKDKKIFTDRIDKMSQEDRKAIREMIKNYERELKEGNG